MSLTCRFCDSPLHHTVVDLGTSPLSNAFLEADQLQQPEMHFPLRVYVCESCLLVQLPQAERPDAIFDDDYAYFSSYSDSWLDHARRYVEHMQAHYDIGADDYVIEVASNDGYLLQYFVDAGVPVLGIDPAQNVADAAEAIGVPTLTAFFDTALAHDLVADGHQADVLIGNNVLAHVPNLNDFVEGLRIVLAPEGVLTMEFPHLLRLMEENQFDTIYHEHFSYFSLIAAERVFAAHGLTLFDVEELSTHGGSLRVYVRHTDDPSHPTTDRVHNLRQREADAGLTEVSTYTAFGERVAAVKRNVLDFLVRAREENASVAGYGAPAKGNTLLNYCGVRTDLLPYTVDRSPRKQDRYLPGTRIPVFAPEKIRETEPEYVLILPWNLKDEIMEQMQDIADWGGQFVVPIPDVRVFDPASGDGSRMAAPPSDDLSFSTSVPASASSKATA